MLLALVLLCLPIWFSLGDHGFNGRSDARYAVVAQEMEISNDWLVPRFMGQVHLTKPPLVYWLEAGSLKLFGETYMAVRLPSAISGTLVIVLLYWFMSRLRGRRVALFACGLYAIMPMTIFPARMTVTDSVLNLCWTMTLMGAYLSSQRSDHRRAGYLLLWFGATLGMLTKGPVMFIPMGLVLVWWLLTRRSRSGAWKHSFAFPFIAVGTLLPALAWALAVVVVQPEAANIWLHETFDRAIGQGDHNRPIWFFFPVLLVGCFPCSAMLLLPGVNLRLRDTWERLRSASLEGFLGFSVIATFVVYSLISGKLPSYLLPICAPLAMLSAMMLARWFTEQTPASEKGRRLPEVRVGLMIGTLLFMLGAGGALYWFYGLGSVTLALGLLPALIISLLMMRSWSVLALRMPLMAGFVLSWVLGWAVLLEAEDLALAEVSYGAVAYETFGDTGWSGRVGVYQLESGIIYWERKGDIEQIANPAQLKNAVVGAPILVLTRQDRWEKLRATNPMIYDQGRIVHRWRQFPGAPMRYLVVFDGTDAKQEGAEFP